MAPSMPTGLIDPKFCCCAVPLVNAGIYAIIIEQAVLGVAIGVTALTSPNAVGVVVPGFAKVIFAILCLVVTLIQPAGFIGVLREKTKTFKVYALINATAVLCAFICAAALIGVSAAKHDDAIIKCQTDFFTPTANATGTGIGQNTIDDAQNSTLQEQGKILCNPFAWADIGIMGGLWLLLLLTQLYFIFYTYSYSKSQVTDHKLYHSVYSQNPEAFTMSILRSSRYNPGSVYNTAPPVGQDDAWDSRPSMDSPMTNGYRDNTQSGYYDPSEEQLAEYDHPQQGQYFDQPDQHAVYPPHAPAGPSGYAQHQESMDFPNPLPAGPSGAAPAYGEYDNAGHGYDAPPQNYDFSRTPPRGGYYPNEPEEARSREASQTPTMNRYSYGQGVGFDGDGGLQRPGEVQNHPAEGMFGRKSPRIG